MVPPTRPHPVGAQHTYISNDHLAHNRRWQSREHIAIGACCAPTPPRSACTTHLARTSVLRPYHLPVSPTIRAHPSPIRAICVPVTPFLPNEFNRSTNHLPVSPTIRAYPSPIRAICVPVNPSLPIRGPNSHPPKSASIRASSAPICVPVFPSPIRAHPWLIFVHVIG
jgi:hypothetical protein